MWFKSRQHSSYRPQRTKRPRLMSAPAHRHRLAALFRAYARRSQLVTSLATITSRSPQQPADVVTEVAATTADGVRGAVVDARAACAVWSRWPAPDRAQALEAAAFRLETRADAMTDLIVREVGKPVGEARGEVVRGVAILRYFAQQTFDPVGSIHAPSMPGLLFSQRRPHGVAGLITPWNFPIAIPLWKAAPALAFGNGVVLKPAPAATATANALSEVFDGVLPEGLFRVVPGDGDAGSALVESADCVSFTGSNGVGSAVARSAVARGVPVQAEMGGQNASVVFADADPVRTARDIASGAFSYAGQKCTATRRVIVVGDHPAFVDAFVDAVGALPLGDPADPATVVGPVINEFAQGAVLDAAAGATRSGGRVLTGGGAPYGDGWYVAPTIVDGVPADHSLCQEETFGPLCVLLRAADEADALRMVNSVRYGLVTGVYTNDLDRVLSFIDDVDTGMVKVNAPTTGVDYYLPFGGAKASGYGAPEQGKAAQDFYTKSRTVTIASSR
jgi:acyl-CoA reductase-like NAD-dependent aldehyde dehydrogenase